MSKLKGRTLPNEFFQRVFAAQSTNGGGGGERSSSPPPMDDCSSMMSRASCAQSWDVVAFLDLRTTTEDGVCIALLPLPLTHSVLRHNLEQLQNCRVIILVTTPDTFPHVRRVLGRLDGGVRVVAAEPDGDPWLIVEYYRRTWKRLWEADTVTLWWEPNVITEHQILWRPVTDKHAIATFVGPGDRRIAVAWQGSAWSTLTSLTALPDTTFVVDVHQHAWKLTNEQEYFAFITDASKKQ